MRVRVKSQLMLKKQGNTGLRPAIPVRVKKTQLRLVTPLGEQDRKAAAMGRRKFCTLDRGQSRRSGRPATRKPSLRLCLMGSQAVAKPYRRAIRLLIANVLRTTSKAFNLHHRLGIMTNGGTLELSFAERML